MINTSAQHIIIPLYNHPAPGSKVAYVREQETISENGSALITNITKPELIYYPAQSDAICPAIIICPGGGYRVLAYKHEGTEVAEWLSSLGYHAFVLKYRLPDRNLVTNYSFIPLADARQAMLKVREQAKENNINSQKIGIMGFSAGGHLAASAATLFVHEIPYGINGTEVRPDFSILVYPLISMTKPLTHTESKSALLGNNPSPALVNLFSLEKQTSHATPPTFIIHAKDDEIVSPGNTQIYASTLKKYRIPVTDIIIPTGGHGFGFRNESPAFEWTTHLANWLKNRIK
jgi:acetyl esterase/lipase